MASFITADTVAFYSVEEFSSGLAYCTQVELQNFVATGEELAAIIQYAQNFTYSGIICFWNGETAYIVCSRCYDYRSGETLDLAVVFNAELALMPEDEPDQCIVLFLGQDDPYSVPIKHSFLQHIFWQDELYQLFDVIDLMEELRAWYDDEDDEDDDDIRQYLYY